MRYKIYQILSRSNQTDIYDILMIAVIVASLLPLTVKQLTPNLAIVEHITTVIFVVDYMLRWLTADYELKRGWKSFIHYPLTFLAVIDLVSLLPNLSFFHSSLRILKVFRLVRSLRVLRIVRYSKNVTILTNVLKRQKDALLLVASLALGYIFVSALVMFTIEPEQFEHFLDALYWATITLTTIGYGDVYAQTDLGQLLTMISAFLGIGVVALPAGIITAGYLEEIQE